MSKLVDNFSLKPKFFYFRNIFLTLLGIWEILTAKHYHIDKNLDLTSFIILFLFSAIVFFLISKFRDAYFYKNTTFELLDDSVKYRRDFINLEQKNVKYSNIKEVKLSQNIIQRFYGIATVLVITHATTQDAGIEIYDIKEYQEVYDFLIEKTKNNT